jgi:CRISPR/Cas system CSM-associated protein Csm3 (group 7 of RAMP superfamily)
MSRDRLTFDLRATVRSPFLFRGLDGRFVGVDVTQLRDETGRPIIPADQVRGVFRQSLAILAEHVALPDGDIDDLFGRPSSATPEDDGLGSNEPGRGRILFADLVATKIVADPDDPKSPALPYVGAGVGETTRIAIDDDTGSVAEGALQVLELVAPFGAAVTFEGHIVIFDAASRADAWAKTLGRALALVQSIGAMKSPGWGEVDAARSSVSRSMIRSLALPARGRALPERVRLRVRFDRPILVDAKKISGNAFEGRSVVPGAVIKGALARRLELAGLDPSDGDLAEVLSRLRFGHARPEAVRSGEVTERPLPLSLVVAKVGEERRVGDASLIGPDQGATLAGAPAVFQPDWKGGDYGIAAARLRRAEGYDDPPLVARTHTRIDEGGGAAEGQLFTTVARSVKRRSTNEAGATVWADRTWLFDVDVRAARGVDADLTDRVLEALLSDGLDGIGRTGAAATFEFVAPAPVFPPRPIEGTADLWVVMLETPAAMVDAAALVDPSGRVVSAEKAYADYWKKVLPTAALVNFFAAQDYRGGYLARRRRLHGDTYFPFLITRAGSVFVLRTSDRAGLEGLIQNGLPHFEPVNGAEVTWRNSPWVSENGYGEVRIDHLSDERALVDAVCGVGVEGDAA